MENVILVCKLENKEYYLGISKETLENLPIEISDNVSFLDEGLQSNWGYEEREFDSDYRYMTIGEDQVDSVILARYASRLLSGTSFSTIVSKKYEKIAF
jgi:hypothetical protein